MYLFNQKFKSEIMFACCVIEKVLWALTAGRICAFSLNFIGILFFHLIRSFSVGASLNTYACSWTEEEEGEGTFVTWPKIHQHNTQSAVLDLKVSDRLLVLFSLSATWHVRTTEGSLSPCHFSPSLCSSGRAGSGDLSAPPLPWIRVNFVQRCTRYNLFPLIALQGQVAIQPFDSILFGIGTLSSWM